MTEPDTYWPPDLDLERLVRELHHIGVEARRRAGRDDLRHLKKIARWGRFCSLSGYGTAWVAPNPLSPLLLAQGWSTRWLLMHHISHRGYDRIPGVPQRYTSSVFAQGKRRVIDWMDWIDPEAWHEEHDFAHHYHLGEQGDPDVVEENTPRVRQLPIPNWSRALVVLLGSAIWRWFYYAPRTLEVLQESRARRSGRPRPPSGRLASPLNERGREFWRRCLLPTAVLRFMLIPAAFLLLGRRSARNVLLNTVVAEMVASIHTFSVIAPNHTAADLYRFDGPVTQPGEFQVRQILGSANYATGGDLWDYLHLWLNYQIEHHLWPDLTMKQYQAVQPKVKELCSNFGLPHHQAGLPTRFAKMMRVVTGSASMKRIPARPESQGAWE